MSPFHPTRSLISPRNTSVRSIGLLYLLCLHNLLGQALKNVCDMETIGDPGW